MTATPSDLYANGARNQFYENMRQAAPGDVVFSFCATRIKALGVVTGAAQIAPKPLRAETPRDVFPHRVRRADAPRWRRLREARLP